MITALVRCSFVTGASSSTWTTSFARAYPSSGAPTCDSAPSGTISHYIITHSVLPSDLLSVLIVTYFLVDPQARTSTATTTAADRATSRAAQSTISIATTSAWTSRAIYAAERLEVIYEYDYNDYHHPYYYCYLPLTLRLQRNSYSYLDCCQYHDG